MKSKQRATTTSVNAIRGALEQRYRETFGCAWDLTPWETHWSTELADAKKADTEYVASVDALAEFERSLHKLVSHATTSGIPRASQLEAYVGRTWGDMFLGGLLADHASAIESISKDVGDALRWLRAESGDLLLDGLPKERRPGFAAVLRESARRADAHGPDRRVFDAMKRSLAAGATRRLRTATLVAGHHLPTLGSAIAPALFGPPRLLDNELGWLRLHLVQIFDFYALKQGEDGTLLPPTDSEIAIVTLLAGTLSSIVLKEDGTVKDRIVLTDVIAKERKAIRNVRRRNTLSAALVREMRGKWEERHDPWVRRSQGDEMRGHRRSKK